MPGKRQWRDEMTETSPTIHSLVTPDGELRLTLEDDPIGEVGSDDVLVEIEGSPINPSDLGELLGPADISTLTGDGSTATASIPPDLLPFAAARLGRSISPGREGAGTVVEAGENAQHLLGKVVGARGGGMYTRFRRLPAAEVVPFPDGVTARQAAAAFVNPLTALGMVSTMRLEGHTALVHTAAASNLGQMLNKLCIADGVPLVNVVRSAQQAELLRGIGATHIVSSASPEFRAELTAAVAETGATLAFDAVGGGTLAGEILAAMEAALTSAAPPSSQYGSPVHKQVYIYGRLDLAPTTLSAGAAGMAWGVGGWLLPYHLARIGADASRELVGRVVSEITTTFASSYTREISLTEALDPEVIRGYQRKATGEKYLVVPSKD
jgi:NADPH:quinone reductase-like Zn-dependent oxidoreductase